MSKTKRPVFRLTLLNDGQWECLVPEVRSVVIRGATPDAVVQRGMTAITQYRAFCAHLDGVCATDCAYCVEGMQRP